MKEFQFERKQRFSLRKYAIGACSVLLGAVLFFAGMGAQPVQATETTSTLISSHYLDEQDLPEKLKSELQWFEENKIEVKEGKEYYFVYRKLATRLPETGLFSNDGMFILGAGLLLLSFTLIKRKKGASYFLVTVFAVGGWGASISAFENLVELQPALVKRVEGQFLPSPETVQGYEFTGYYLVRDSASKELTVDKVESPALSQKEESSEPQFKKIVPQTASHFSSTEDLVQSPQPSYAVEKIVEAPVSKQAPDEIVPIGTKEEVAGNPQGEQPKAENNSDYKTSPEEGVLNATVEKPELLVTTEEVAFQTIEQEDATLAKGQTKVVQEGVVGERTIYTEVTVVNGEKSSKVIENIITKEPVNKVIAVGTKEEVAPKPTQPVTPDLEESRPVQHEKIEKKPIVENETEKKPADGIGQPTPEAEATPGEKQTPDKPEAEPKQPEPASPAVESEGEENQTLAPQGTESNQPSKETAETKDSESATPAVESGREEDQFPAEQKGEENQLENPVEGVKDVGESAPQETQKQPEQPEQTAPSPEVNPSQGNEPEPAVQPEPLAPQEQPTVPSPVMKEKVLEYKTTYKASPALNYKEQRVEVAGENGKEVTTTSYSFDESTGKIVENTSTKIEKHPVDRVVKVGNVEETTSTTKRGEQFVADESLDKGVKEVRNQGQDEETTTIKVYKVNEQTGDLTEPDVTTKVAKPMQAKITAVGTKSKVEIKDTPFETRYVADETLSYKEKVETPGERGRTVSTTKYTVNQETGAISEETTTENIPAKDKVIKVGNVEKIVSPIDIIEERKDDPELPKGKEVVEDAGEQGETTVTKTYEVNPETGELTNPVEKTEITKAMRQKVILVGTKEDKPHLLPENSELENAVNVTQASTEMKSIDLLTNEKLKSQLAPSDIEINRDLFLKRKELQKTNPNITESEVKEILRKEYLEKLSIKETLDATKNDLEASLKKVAAHTLSILGDNQQNREKVKGDIEANKEKILLGLSYINRFYNIDFGDTNIRDILAYNPSSFGKKDVTSLDWLKHLGSMSYDELRLTNSPKTFEKYFGKITDKPTLLEFLDYNRTTFTNMDGDTWLKKATKAIIVEKSSKEKPDEKVDLYTKLTTDPKKYGAEERKIESRRQQNVATLLGLVNIKEPSVYVLTNIATVTYGNIGTYMDTSLEKTDKDKYKKELEKVKELMELAATRQATYVDTLYRITKEENRSKLVTSRVIVDTMKKYTSNTNADITTTWSEEFGSTADKGVKDFMTPLGMYSPSQRVGAEANGVGVRYFTDRVLDDRGAATYSHEMTHLLDGTVLFNNHGRRDGTAAEFYARGIFENSYTPEEDTYFNLNFVYDETNKNGFYNKTPDRFKTDADLKSYMHGSFDVLYSLDYLEAEATKQLTAEDKTKYFKKITPIKTTGVRTPVTYANPAVQATHKSEKISEITLTEAEKLTDINSLIDNNILVNRYIIKGFTDKGDIKANGYYLVDMFDTIYGVSQNDSGMSGDITFRKQAFELMAALGYYEGFVPYVSNQYKQAAEAENKPLSDTYIFNKILNGKSYAEFKKAQIKERVDRLNQLKPLTIQYEGQEISLTSQKLSELMQKAVQEELKQIKAGNTTARTYTFIETPVKKLKKAIYKAYLKDSDDFRQSIYNS
ncbi:ZmpA/ZmpB/ZmpC family metallo-endopeptidase [Streptococcus pneumoniae]|uniref:ZmpA/ZmpB/ZmpC family metallo-endopeptidase n=1 Tax=Streptococcus pneumoniae TaxID=1313 RepID=UPI0005E2E0EE|nr:ZmpA/ZmpB/ZmpC family metallo-endopeptidase [Streptococcus pneumoniae]CIS32190.1 Zinc metalloprotease zmpC [Streptococcus pneumoniae]CIU09435.1 Zinc metalloprotease zmpC [Streptococcus pneumoniae]CJF85925.1 Zinc metalloprotease zmpC [Streptococcus pneumoniae]CJL07227.1 Zinc metalloprotease zmpC [Streptococcus pneumoniae]CJM05903.1 Zinc metalloprotease zmpC [Streptococcus pneumoniae]